MGFGSFQKSPTVINVNQYTTLDASFDEIQYIFREEANRAYTKQRHDKQDRDEIEREKVRNNIREKYGIQKKIDSPREVRAVEVSVIVKIYLLQILIILKHWHICIYIVFSRMLNANFI